MSVKIRPARLDEDGPAICRFLQENLADRPGPERFEWLYRRNPAGLAAAWVAESDSEADLVGVAAALPRRARLDGAPVVGWCLADFAVRRDHRSLGPGLALQRACLEPVLSGQVPFCYDHPAASMMAIYRRLKTGTTLAETRHVRLVRGEAAVRRLLGPGFLARASAWPLDALLAARDGLASAGGNRYEFTVCSRSTDADPGAPDLADLGLTDLDAVASRGRRLHLVRDAEYLRWRYLDDPRAGHELLVARDADGPAVAMLVCTTRDGSAYLAEIAWRDGDEPRRGLAAARWLLARLAQRLRSRGIQSIQFPVHAGASLAAALKGLSFTPRETAPIILCAAPSVPSVPSSAGLDPRLLEADWLVTFGDRLG